MEAALPYLLGLAMLATLVVLVVGVVSFGVSGDFYRRHANNLMRMRVVMQGFTVAVLALMVFLAVA
ncbi:MAG: HIG1 domain-containing protein [Proteobacteria bacterium]|nr:HIG1 domain-containing protein [Pseudomonadota bacterium]